MVDASSPMNFQIRHWRSSMTSVYLVEQKYWRSFPCRVNEVRVVEFVE